MVSVSRLDVVILLLHIYMLALYSTVLLLYSALTLQCLYTLQCFYSTHYSSVPCAMSFLPVDAGSGSDDEGYCSFNKDQNLEEFFKPTG